MAMYPDVKYINAYVSGSMAYEYTAVSQKKNVTLPKPQKKKKIILRIDPVATVGIVLAFACMIMLVAGFMRLQDAQNEVEVLEHYVNDLKQENQKLQTAYDESYDLEEVEKIALAIGMVPKEEITIVTIDTPVMMEEEKTPSRWESFWMFLTGLFA